MKETEVPLPEPWYKSKTLIFNLLTAVVTLIGLLTDSKLIPLEWTPYILIAVNFINYILRSYFTVTTVDNSGRIRDTDDLKNKNHIDN